MPATIQALLQREFRDYSRTRRLPVHVHHAARSMIQCRTAALGGHVMGCSAGHIAGVWYNSCRHRSCPQCSKLQIDRWLDGWRERILPCDHYHVIFTMPHELLVLWQINRKRMIDHLFRASRDTLFELLADERHLGVVPGVIAALHTWGRTLTLHPHVHCLVTGGGRACDGRWRAPKNGFLLPVRVVEIVFRSKMMALLQKDLERGVLVTPPELSESALSNLVRRVYSKSWNVRLKERYEHGQGVISYLARYVRGGPIRNRRLHGMSDGAVRFSYKDHRDGRRKAMALGADEFMRRLFWHVPEPRSHVVRLYGIYGRSQGAQCEACRESLIQGRPSARNRSRPPPTAKAHVCSICGRPLGCVEDIAPGSPPYRRPELPQQLQSP